MPFRTSRKNGMSRRSTALKPYPGGQTRRQTEEHGDLNVYNRMYQFYNYHADKDILIDEMCRGLILSLLRISGGTVQEYDEPLGWTSPYWQDHCAHHHAIVFHMKDQRRHSTTFAKTLSSFSGKDMATSPIPSQFDADVKVDHSAVPTAVQLHKDNGEMKSMTEAAAELAMCIKIWIATQTYGVSGPAGETPVRGLDLVPSRLQLLKRCIVSGQTSYEIVVDDREFEASKVDVAAYTTVTLQNVTPASGDSLMTGDPLAADTINHVPLKGKMYTFSGPVPKVWDRHRAELQHLFKPSFFEKGRYLLPNSKLHDETMDDFRTFPRGRHIWSNCVGEDRITFAPGSTQKLKLEYRMKTSVRDFFHKFRNDDISSSKLGRCVCLALEPQIRRQHVGQPISAVLPKRIWRDGVVNTAVQYEPYMWAETLEVDPDGLSTGRKVITKVIRQVFTLDTTQIPTSSNTNPATAELWWTDGGFATKTPGGVLDGPTGWEPLKWDSITRNMLDEHPQLGHFVSKGDPIMFNVQINRLYTGSSLLKNHTRLGADKTGVKRKHEDKMYSNMGDVSFARAQQLGDVYKDHNLQSATAVGVAPLILEGDDKNTMVTVNVAAEEQAFENALMAMDADPTKAGLQLDMVSNALQALDDVIDTDGLKVRSDTLNFTGPTASDIADAIAGKTLQTHVGNKQVDWVTIGGTAYSVVGILGLLAKARGFGSAAAADMEEQIRNGAKSFTAVAFLAAVALTGLADIAEIAHFIFDVSSHKKVTVTGTVDIGNPGDIAHNVTGATADEIANAIEGKVLKVKSAPNTSVNIAVPEPEALALAADIADKIAEKTLDVKMDQNARQNLGDAIAFSHAQRTDHKVEVTNHPTSVEVSNHPTSVEVSNHPTSVEVSNHPTPGTVPTADEIAAAIAADNVETGVYYYATNDSALGIYCHKILLPDGTLTGYTQAVMANGGWANFGVRQTYQGKKVYKFDPDRWIVADDSVDIGQTLTIPDGALTATVNIPSTINVSGTVSVDNFPQANIGTVVHRSFGFDATNVANVTYLVRMDTGEDVTQSQHVTPSAFPIGTRVVRIQDGTFAELA